MRRHQRTCSTSSRIWRSRCGSRRFRGCTGAGLRRGSRMLECRIERPAGAAGAHNARSGECACLPSCGHRGHAVIHGRPLRAIAARGLRVLQLDGGRRVMSPAGCGQLSRCRAGRDAAGAAIVAYVAHGDVVDHGFRVHVRDIGDTDVIHGPVIEERAVVPIAALVSYTGVTETVADAPVKADGRPPVSSVPAVGSVAPAPVPGRPECALEGRRYPRARNPVVSIVRIPRPVSGRPDIPGPGTYRLLVNRQRRRSNAHRYAHANADLGARGCR